MRVHFRKALNHMVVKNRPGEIRQALFMSLVTSLFSSFTNVSLFLLPYGSIYFVKRIP